MITIFIFALVFFMFTLIAQWLLHKVRKNYNYRNVCTRNNNKEY